jgi:multicomponent Na+:H+ antiporter subunit E
MKSADTKRPPKRVAYEVFVFVLLFLTWLVFSGIYDGFHLTLGLISCGLVTWMSSDLLFEDRASSIRGRLLQAARLIAYLFWLLWQVVLANLHLLRLAFANRDAIHPQIVRYESKLESDFEKYLLANSITLTPGTVTIKIMGSTYYIHAISDVASAGLDGEMERRIAHIFSTEPKRKADIGAT